jgi:hypothetical protein
MAAKFRLRMATQAGERRARDEGFSDFPVDPFAIARKHSIYVEKKPPGMKGVSGALIFAEPQAIIIYSSEHENEGFENFSVAHELGHYFLPGHPDEIHRSGGTHFSRAGFREGTSSIELEADHFAAGLLMPDHLVRRGLAGGQLGLQGVRTLADQARVSVTAAAIRAAECARFPLCVVVSQGSAVSYAFPSDAFKGLGKRIFLRKGDPLPACATASFNADPANVAAARQVVDETSLRVWFDTDRNVPLDEEVIGLGRYGLTLTVLSSEALEDDGESDDDEEHELIERWTPKFAYGR